MATNRFLTLVSGLPRLVQAISASVGSADANKIIATASNGLLGVSILPARLRAIVEAAHPPMTYDAISSTEPSTPTNGFRWLEVNSSGLKIGDWTYRSSTSDWIENDYSVVAASGTNISVATTVRLSQPSRISSKLLIDSVEGFVGSGGAQSGSAFYTFTLQSIPNTTTVTTVSGVTVFNSQSAGLGTVSFSQQNANVTLTTGTGAALGLVLQIGKTSTPANINFEYRVTVRRIR